MMVIPSEQTTERYSKCTYILKAEPFILATFRGTEGIALRSQKLLPTLPDQRNDVPEHGMADNFYLHPLHVLSRAGPSISLNLIANLPSASIGIASGTCSHSEQWKA